MKSFLSTKLVAAAALAAAALAAASAAQANPNVYFSVGFQGAPAYAAPVYVQPRSVYVQPRPVYIAPPAFVYGRPWQPSYDRRYEDERAWRHAEWQRREWRQHHWEQQPSRGRHWD
jgi:hypothetical protein